MCNTKKYNGVFRNTSRVFLKAAFVMMILLSLTSVKVAFSAEMNGVIKEMPGLGWPYGIWYLEDKRVQITEETVFKGDQSKATFGTKVVVKGSNVDNVFTAYEIEVRTEDDPVFADN
ncbi:MAG: hypothetical protein WGN25_01360 [Candidatus Electrothrix sp. GW3-4]|uniref:hypothetical protein n=1 Tax=Candidatus Electrothrix sp. GW3-4 TaxID=3126740 RepID=UPI0030CFF087